MLDGWQNVCKTLRLYDYSLFITGSNSKLLSGEFTKELSGRYVAFRIRPFVYKEITEYAKELGKEVSITDYLWVMTFGYITPTEKRSIFCSHAVKKYFIQVAYNVADDKAYTREFEAFKNIDNLSQKILISNDNIDYSTSTVRHIRLKDFLLMNHLGES